MSTERDDAATRRYREASGALGERPSAATRAAILAAAARQVEAGPQPADAPRVVRRPRWPMAAVAAVLLSTLAVMMANRTEQEMPSFTVPAAPKPESMAVAPAPSVTATPSSENVAPASTPSPPSAEAPSPTARRSTSKVREERSSVPPQPTVRMEPQRSEATNSAAPAPSAERAPEIASAESRQAFPAEPPYAPAASPRAAPLGRSAPAPAAAGAMRAPDIAAEKPTASSADRASAREDGQAQSGAASLDAAREFEGSAPAWLERIVRLRREGRHTEADAELKRFRERYPEVQVPPAALSSAAPGTR